MSKQTSLAYLLYLSGLIILLVSAFSLDLHSQFLEKIKPPELKELRAYHEKNDTPIYHIYYNYPTPEKNVSFCGEIIPLSETEVFEAFERDFLVNVNDRTQMTMLIKRAGRFFPYVESRLSEAGLPDDLKYLMVAESGMLDAISSAGAVGFWQIMKGTGKQYGLDINKEVDERYNLIRATDVAITYLKEAYQQFGKWTLASAAYNMGVAGIASSLKTQRKDDYFKLWLNRETIRYVYRIASIKEIMENSHKYGFGNVIPYKPLDIQTIEVSTHIQDLVAWSEEKGFSYKDIKYLNPWIRQNFLPTPSNSIKKYLITTPKHGELKPVQ